MKSCYLILRNVRMFILYFWLFFPAMILSPFRTPPLVALGLPKFSQPDWTQAYPAAPTNSRSEVDVVFTWVDGEDPEWIALRNKWAQKEGRALLGSDSTHAARFHNNDELRYALRSVHENFKFARHIFIVTCGQIPKWFKPHPKITLVPHSDFFRDKSHLPTFNSHAIESNLHSIYRLSEHYVYMNDDFFLGRSIKYEDLYSKNGQKIKVFFSKKNQIKAEKPKRGDIGYVAGNKNTARFLDKFFGYKKRFAHQHTPYPQIKSLVLQVERICHEAFLANSSHRFRSLQDHTVTNGLIPHVAVALRRAEPGTASTKTVGFGNNYQADVLNLRQIIQKKTAFFCLNETLKSKDPRSYALIAEFLQILFPSPAPWEKIPTRGKIPKKRKEQLHARAKTLSQKEKLKLFDRAVQKIRKNKRLQREAFRVLSQRRSSGPAHTEAAQNPAVQ